MSTPDVAAAEQALGLSFPGSLRSLYAERDGWYNGEGHGEWWVIWPVARLVEENRRTWADGTLDRHLLAFGDDGTGAPFCLDHRTDTDEVLRWNWLDRAVETREGALDRFVQTWCVG